GNWDSLTVRNCTVKNIYLTGIYAPAQTSVTGIRFAKNTVYNVTGVSMQSAGIMLSGGEGVVDSNVCTNSSMGISLDASSNGFVRFNMVDSCEVGIRVKGNNDSTFLSSNLVTNSDQGIQTVEVNAPILLAGDTIKGCGYGLALYGLGTSSTGIQYSIIDGMDLPGAVGIYASTDVYPLGVGDVKGLLMRNQIIHNSIGILLNEPVADTTKDVLVIIGGDSSSYNLICDNDSFALYLEHCNDDINATYNYWGKSLVSQIEQEIYHQVDDPSLGLVDFSQPYLLGDVNTDRAINAADVVYLINYLFIGGPAPVPILQVGDVNCDAVINAADVVYLINYLFIGGPPPSC
ncbi:MAG: right-handed parallel beta-helix repeat-containing protein, partial [candidate division Zixibacteria bacterium]|nr:right-handed parallel beta-helix repeat-containing protein [candidate division Zixibacteria bacterium]